MRSLDTNVVVRLLTEDDPAQTPLARKTLEGPIYISDGVIMETEWVLRSRYRWSRERINSAFEQLILLKNVEVADRLSLLWCLERHRGKADLADMLHIVASPKASAFLTFEAELAVEAGPDSPVPVEVLQ